MNTFKTAALAALVALGSFAAPAAKADSIYFGLGLSDGGVDYAGFGGGEIGLGLGWKKTCSIERALDKAHDLGFKKVHLETVKAKKIVVSGRRYGDWYDIVFARKAGCPVIAIH